MQRSAPSLRLPVPRLARGLGSLLAVAALAGPSLGAEWTRKLDPGLASAIRAGGEDTLVLWVGFADKGESGAADLARRLAEAEVALAPRARARRLRARVHPVVDFRDLPLHQPYLSSLAAAGFRVEGALRWLNGVAVRAPARRAEDLAQLPFVSRLSIVRPARRSADPEGPETGSGEDAAPEPPAASTARAAVSYGLTASQNHQIQVPALHDSGYTGAGVLVCVLDAGFNWFDKHEALRDHSIPPERQRDFVRGIPNVQDTTDAGMVHGTQVLGCIAGRKIGTYVGTAFDAEFALARTEVVQQEIPQEMVWWGMGAEWADSLGADLITSSLGYFAFDPAYADQNYSYEDMDGRTTIVSQAAQIAAAKGILVVTAVGNEGQSAWRWLIAPSDVHGDSVIAVGAVNSLGVPAAFSSYGPSADGRVKPDLAARGVTAAIVATTGDPSAYGTNNGTSFSTPQVAGLAACLMQARPAWTPSQVARALRASASQAAAPDMRVGYGVPSGQGALTWSPEGPGPGGPVVLRMAGPNPVVFSRGPARVAVAAGGTACGRAATLRVLDLQGRRVRELWSGVVSCAVTPIIAWDGQDDEGRRARPGLYLLELRAGSERASLRVIVLG